MIQVAGQHKWRRFYVNGNLLETGPAQRVHFTGVGFDWGPGGDPDDMVLLARALLLELTHDKIFAVTHEVELVHAYVSKLGTDFTAWTKLDEWVTERGGKVIVPTVV